MRALRRFRERFTVRWLPAGTPSGLLLAGVLAVGVAVPLWHAGPARAAARAGPVSYLVATQRADGGWGLGPGETSSAESTGWVVIGLAAARAPASAIARGAEWIRTHEGQIQTPGDLERTILALAAARAPLGGLVERLDRQRRANGSFDGQANWTAFAILAQRAAGAPIDDERAWLERQQNADGGFGFAQRGDPSDIDDTAGAVEALVAAGAPVARATRFLERAENPDGGFPLEPGGDSNAQSTAWAVQALLAARAPVSRPLDWLAARISSAGAVDYAPGNAQTPVWVTGEALAALARAPLPYVSGR